MLFIYVFIFIFSLFKVDIADLYFDTLYPKFWDQRKMPYEYHNLQI